MNANQIQKEKSSIASVIKSVFSAMLGVQSRAKASEDFQKSNITQFIVVGLVMVLLFIGALALVVNIVLK